jgi:hypothetical protein
MSTAADTDGLAVAASAPKRAASTEVTVTFFRDWAARTKTEERLSLDALAERIRAPTAPVKEDLPWLKFARFGLLPTKHGSLRSNGNVTDLSGVVGEHDGEKMTIEEAVEKLDKAGVTALIYSSPSHMWDGHGPRWRVCCPFSEPLPPDQHDQMISRLNGVLGGVLAPESWTLSQSYYFGAVEGRPEPQVEIVDGTAALDQCDELDEIAVGKPNGSAKGHDRGPGNPEAPIEDIVAAMDVIPNDDLPWPEWNTIGMATWRASGGSEEAFEAFSRWSRKSPKYDAAETRFRWDHYATSPPSQAGFGTLVFWARQAQPRWTSPRRQQTPASGRSTQGISLDDFYAYMPMHKYIYGPSREMWPADSINARIPPVVVVDAAGHPVLDHKGQPTKLRASLWLDQNKPVEQMTWAPGLPMVIRDRLISDGEWIRRSGVSCFNLYRPPIIGPGDPDRAGPWLDHVRKVFADDADHIVTWLAHRVQRPQEKINHALVLGGKQGIGKDTILEPVKRAVGPWNFAEVSPQQLIGRFNGFVKSVILRISEARDLGDVNRYQFYDHMKSYTAAPPDVLLCDEKKPA